MSSDLVISASFDRWIAGLERVGAETDDAVGVWRAATDVLFAESQQVVHILSGHLLSTGHVNRVSWEDGQLVGEVKYDADYAFWEFRRGGSHDAPTRSLVATENVFQRALLDVVEAQIHGG